MAYHSAPPLTSTTTCSVSRRYAWVIFALTFGLLISDYMSRQVLNAVFPLLKAEWNLSDSQLGALGGVVALMVGLLTFPISLLADRWGRIKSIVVMAALWSIATLGCGLSQSYDQMLLARLLVGIGEAAYGSVGIAVVLSVFPMHLRATLTGAFMAGAMIGSVLGIALGGILAVHFGWRWSFAGMALLRMAMALVYLAVIRQDKIYPNQPSVTNVAPTSIPSLPQSNRVALSTLVSTHSVICAYIGSGLQLFMVSAVMAWMPSYLNRYYGLTLDRAAGLAAVFVFSCAIGMLLCGMLSDRFSRNAPERKVILLITFCLLSVILLLTAFNLPNGKAQLILIAIGMFFAAGSSGPAGAMVANLTNPSVHGSAFATLTLANNLLGLAPGPFVIGALADRFGLHTAFQLMPLIGIFSAVVFLIAKHHYLHDLQHKRPFLSDLAGVTAQTASR